MIETEQKAAPSATPAPPPPPDRAPEPRRRGLPAPLRALLVLSVLAVVATLVWYFFLRRPPEPANVLSVTGRLEGDDSAVAAKVAGRIREITVREGDRVTAGQVIASLDDEQLEQSRLGIEQARTDARGRVDQAEAQVATAEAELARAQANYEQARWDAERFSRLAKQGVESERTAKQAEMQAEAQSAAVRAAHKQVDVARAAVETAKANLANPGIRTAATAAVQKQIIQAQSDIDAARADADRARSLLTEAQANRADLSIIAPFAGTVATRAAEPGEVVAPGTPIITLVDLSQVYLRAFVPEGDIRRVQVGQKARVYLDGAPDKPLEAVVERIDPEASFTPENTYFRDDRVKQVFGVRVRLTAGEGAAKPGMPADGQILVEGDAWPEGARRS